MAWAVLSRKPHSSQLSNGAHALVLRIANGWANLIWVDSQDLNTRPLELKRH
jgi:hypothetical protein